MDQIIVMNLGTTSFKFKLYALEPKSEKTLAVGEVECIGSDAGKYVISYPDGSGTKGDLRIPDHGAGFRFCIEKLRESGTLTDLNDLAAVAFKAVHGGNISGTCIVDEKVMAEMERVMPLAPAHNAIYLSVMRSIRDQYPDLCQIARFETSFHSTIPEKRAVFGIPYEWREELGLRRRGFHGSSHQYIARTIAKRQPDAKRVISCHLGGSSSVCAILNGESVATSMGATLQTGLMQNNRVGDFEVCCLPYIMENTGMTMEQVMEILNTRSGLLGLSGVSNHYHLVQQAAEQGNARAKLTVEAYEDNLTGLIGAYTAYLGGLDALVFTGGIGYRGEKLRKAVCDRFGYLGMQLDDAKNESGCDDIISAPESKVTIWRLKTDEESVVAGCARELLGI